ncbi:hypothetical protein ACFQHV_07255 [Promicromonospora thailandica]|uniref:Uncharacterized protein n=1 Tax=Promicromonospora thailandica TaxID=765201 RepID=A0A9X2JYI3_9MICO|nr:hypothetical protein [Promicromonospora thailandica]MCP2267243.1 hypothetical protein [Promicromonospora thailandica]BFF17447.1 hypothetical protein GCM10025730_09680 [Promicromonospora thailandica]
MTEPTAPEPTDEWYPRSVRAEDLGLPHEPRVNLRGVLLTLGVLVSVGLVVFVLLGPTGVLPRGDVWPRPAVAVGTLDGHDVAVLAYDLPGTDAVVAYDTVTGERLWKRPAEWQARPLAAGTEHAIVRDDQQLRILDLRDGSTVAEGADVAGLDLPHGELNWWEDGDAADPQEGVVYVSTHDGFPETRPDLVRAVPFDGTAAAPLTPGQAERWGCYVESVDAGAPADVSDPAVLVDDATGVVVPDVCALEWPRSADGELAPATGLVATVTPADTGLSHLVLRDGDTEVYRLDQVDHVAVARTTPSGGAVIVVQVREPALFGLTSRALGVLVLVSPEGVVTQTQL